MKTKCGCCGTQLGHLASKFQVFDGYLCQTCPYLTGCDLNVDGIAAVRKMTIAEVKEEVSSIRSSIDVVSGCKPTAEIGGKVKFFDAENALVLRGQSISMLINYGDILDFDLVEETGNEIISSKTKGGLGRAIVGAATFGSVGAIVGGTTGTRKTNATSKTMCDAIYVLITTSNKRHAAKRVDFLAYSVERGGVTYNTAMRSAQECIARLKAVTSAQSDAVNTPGTVSAADEIMKFKNLLDAGVLTQEGFDAKKKQLLGV